MNSILMETVYFYIRWFATDFLLNNLIKIRGALLSAGKRNPKELYFLSSSKVLSNDILYKAVTVS